MCKVKERPTEKFGRWQVTGRTCSLFLKAKQSDFHWTVLAGSHCPRLPVAARRWHQLFERCWKLLCLTEHLIDFIATDRLSLCVTLCVSAVRMALWKKALIGGVCALAVSALVVGLVLYFKSRRGKETYTPPAGRATLVKKQNQAFLHCFQLLFFSHLLSCCR